ncbi:MAG: hypothetical protein OEV40_07355 [Acidimicrobiia bacterium]|nr:hypothetical protein [Acidimicrobiia bacterium]
MSRGSAHGVILSTLPPNRSRWLHGDLVTRLNRRMTIECVVVHEEDQSTDA